MAAILCPLLLQLLDSGLQSSVRTTCNGPVDLGVWGLVQDAERGHFRRRVQHCIQCSHKETWCVRENAHSTVKLELWNVHSPLTHFLGKSNAAQARTNELWENKKHNWGEHKVFPEKLFWDVIFWSGNSHEAQMRVKKFFWDDPCGTVTWQSCSMWNQSTTRNVTGQSQPSMQ